MWHLQNTQRFVEFLQFNSLSNHTHVAVSLSPFAHTSKRTFKFQNMWMLHPNFTSILKETWNTPVVGTRQYTFMCETEKFEGLSYEFEHSLIQPHI